jgi:predicted transcriptional regulator
MRVDRIYTRRVVRTTKSSTLEQAADLMRRYHVGALIVAEDPPDDADAIGVLTDRDIVIQAVARGFDIRSVRVGDLMTPTVGVIPEHADLHDALEAMRSAGVRRLAVTGRDGRMVGMLSMDDVIDGLAADFSSLAGMLKTEVEREREALGQLA